MKGKFMQDPFIIYTVTASDRDTFLFDLAVDLLLANKNSYTLWLLI